MQKSHPSPQIQPPWQKAIRGCVWILALPVLVWLVWRSYLVISFNVSFAFTQTEIYLLPQDYIGPVVVVYNQPDGQPVELEWFDRVYRIPANGIYKTTADSQTFISRRFFYVDQQGGRGEIYERHDCSTKLPSDLLMVCGMPSLTGYNGQKVPRNRGVIVGRPGELQQLTQDFYKLQESIPR